MTIAKTVRQLILFDIDGTLIYPGTLARQLMNETVEDVAGKSPHLRVEDVAGFTDPVIIRKALKRVQFDHRHLDSRVESVLEQYLLRLKERYPAYREPRLYGDALELVRQCKCAGWVVGLLSGNLRAAAKVKLARFGIWDKFAFGVFGDEVSSREDLLWIARERAWDVLSEAFTYERMVLVGDTPNDAKIANLNNVRSLIVCRHPEWKEKIREQNPTWLVDSLDNVDGIVGWFST